MGSFEQQQKTGTIEISTDEDDGQIVVENGAFVSASFANQTGEAAVLSMLGLDEGLFQISNEAKAAPMKIMRSFDYHASGPGRARDLKRIKISELIARGRKQEAERPTTRQPARGRPAALGAAPPARRPGPARRRPPLRARPPSAAARPDAPAAVGRAGRPWVRRRSLFGSRTVSHSRGRGGACPGLPQARRAATLRAAVPGAVRPASGGPWRGAPGERRSLARCARRAAVPGAVRPASGGPWRGCARRAAVLARCARRAAVPGAVRPASGGPWRGAPGERRSREAQPDAKRPASPWG
ncbi:MAG: DUF4388 domain-containing protein [Planctomycetota bacterium]